VRQVRRRCAPAGRGICRDAELPRVVPPAAGAGRSWLCGRPAASGQGEGRLAGQALAERDENLGSIYLREAADPLDQLKQVAVICECRFCEDVERACGQGDTVKLGHSAEHVGGRGGIPGAADPDHGTAVRGCVTGFYDGGDLHDSRPGQPVHALPYGRF
jgi:hypothetical protein